MDIVSTDFNEVKKIHLTAHSDERGLFKELYRKDFLQKSGLAYDFVQDNFSFSKKQTIRGMHFQTGKGQAKLVSVLEGEILDVVVDVRKNSSSFGRWIAVPLRADRHEQLLIPEGFAHGFCVLSTIAIVLYKVSTYYSSETERGFRYDDPDVGIVWPTKEPILSKRDREAPPFFEVCE